MRREALYAIPALFIARSAAADPETLGAYGHHMGGWGGGFLGFGMMVLFWGALIAIAGLAFQWFGKDGFKGNGGKPSAFDVLRDRFARGEIDLEDFGARRKVLSDQG
jgi:putative membrane protein